LENYFLLTKTNPIPTAETITGINQVVDCAPGDENYSPMSRIYFIEWKDPKSALLLQTKNDIDVHEKAGQISVNLAKPMNADHIVNAPIVDPFQ
jgi:hypothetical protein